MTGSAFTNYLTTYLEASQSISNGTFSRRSSGIPQTNYAITAGDAMKYMNINSLPMTSNQYPTWGQLVAAKPTNVPVYITSHLQDTGDNFYNLYINTIGGVNVDTDVTGSVYVNSYDVHNNPVTRTVKLSIPSGSNTSPANYTYYINPVAYLGTITPLSSADQVYYNGD